MVSRDNADLTVTYAMEEGFGLKTDHFHACTDGPDESSNPECIPQNNEGNPIPGHFAHSEDIEWGTADSLSHTFTFDGTFAAEDVYIAAHAEVWVLADE